MNLTTKLLPRSISFCMCTNVSRFHLDIIQRISFSAALCNDPGNIGNGMVTFNGNSVGEVATYTCDPRFELIGNSTTTCTLVDMDSAEFQPVPPSCMREYTEYTIWNG